MTFFVKCDKCGKMQQAPCNDKGEPYNPVNDKTHLMWYSKTKDRNEIHACSKECIPKDEGVLPL